MMNISRYGVEQRKKDDLEICRLLTRLERKLKNGEICRVKVKSIFFNFKMALVADVH